MRGWDALPKHQIVASGGMSAQFEAFGILDYQDAARFVHQLPYGRNTDRANYQLVLPELRGTCSTKHALLAALAIEQRLPVDLTLGIYEMNDRNTPGVGRILEKHGLAFIPEAHCYLAYEAIRIDVTRETVAAGEPIALFLHEEPIAPEQIGDYKVAMHQAWMRERVAREMPHRDWRELWKIREECIAALSGSG